MRYISLLEAMHELTSKIISLRMVRAVKFCEEVHGFRRQRGARTAIGGTKLDAQIAARESKTLCQVLFGFAKGL